VLHILSVTFPFFALVLCGYLAARWRLLPLQSIAGLNGFVLFFALPCMLYRFGSTTPLVQLLNAGVFLTWLACALVMVALAIALSLNSRIRWNDASFGALVATFPNTGFMGVPLLVALLGAGAAGPIIVCIVVDMVITTSLCIALSRLDGADAKGATGAAKNALKGVAANPMPWAILLGAVASAWHLVLPEPVLQTVGLMADAASPVALFAIGAVLARAQMLAQQGRARVLLLRDYLSLAVLKLFVHPLVVLLVGTGAMALGVPLGHDALTVLVLLAALPSASNVSLLAERYGADNGRIARVILVTTVASFLTFSLAVKLVE
jgi:malonate transporter